MKEKKWYIKIGSKYVTVDPESGRMLGKADKRNINMTDDITNAKYFKIRCQANNQVKKLITTFEDKIAYCKTEIVGYTTAIINEQKKPKKQQYNVNYFTKKVSTYESLINHYEKVIEKLKSAELGFVMTEEEGAKKDKWIFDEDYFKNPSETFLVEKNAYYKRTCKFCGLIMQPSKFLDGYITMANHTYMCPACAAGIVEKIQQFVNNYDPKMIKEIQQITFLKKV